MARYTDAKCRLCRREGTQLFLKGDRCYSEKCAVTKHPNATPGQHGKMRKKLSDYAVQLREKQKVRRVYGVLEGQFHQYYVNADKAKGVTGVNLLMYLERRLDNVVYRLGFANSRSQARQMVRHGLFTLNGKKVNIPSILLNTGDSIEIPEANRKIPVFADAAQAISRRGLPAWLEVDTEAFKGVVKAMPQREDITFPIAEHFIVELYSK